LTVLSSDCLTPLPAWGVPVTVSGGHAAAHAPVHVDLLTWFSSAQEAPQQWGDVVTGRGRAMMAT